MGAHGLMFHHFHGRRFSPSQGAISADTFDRLLAHYAHDHTLLPAAEYLARATLGTLRPDDVCLTFDDTLLCQYEIALPVLEARGLTAFWFVYSSVVVGGIEPLEVYRRFRSEYFTRIDDFYTGFLCAVAASPHGEYAAAALETFDPTQYLGDFPFYTDGDRRYRYLRDSVLGTQAYDDVMEAMIRARGTTIAKLASGLWMNAAQIRQLHAGGHVVGLHSHTHSTTLAAMPVEQQYREYAENQRVLGEILQHKPTTMSHPCNSYSSDTLDVLDGLGIKLGFRSNMAGPRRGALEHPREDHSNIVRSLALTEPQARCEPMSA